MPVELTTTREAAKRKTSFLIYGASGVGKTSLAKTLRVSSDDRLLYVAVDAGQLALRDRDFSCLLINKREDAKDLTALQMVAKHIQEVQSGPKPYEAIFVDGLDDLSEMTLDELKKVDPGYGSWGDLATMTFNFQRFVTTQPGTVVITTHEDEVTAEEGRLLGFRPSFIGGKMTKKLVNPYDEVLALRKLKGSAGKEIRKLQCSTSVDDRYLVKDRSGILENWEDPNIQTVIDKIHEAVTEDSEKTKGGKDGN